MAALAPLLPFVTAGASALSGIAGFQNAQYQSEVANNNSKLLGQQAERETFAANQDIKDQDLMARAQVAELMSQMDASGLSSTSGTMLFRRAGAEHLALQDRDRLSLKRDVQLENTKRQQASSKAETKALKGSAGIGLLTSILGVGSSYLSGASTLNDYNKGRLALNNPSYAG